MPRTYSVGSKSSNEKTEKSKAFGSLPFIFENRKHFYLVEKVQSTNTDSMHYIKHMPLRLTRTRPSYPLSSSDDYLDNGTQNESILPLQKYEKEINLFSKTFCRSISTTMDQESISIPSNDVILTPFAQILSNLHIVRDNIFEIGKNHMHETIKKETEKEEIEKISFDGNHLRFLLSEDDKTTSKVKETCETLDWCLANLENVQTHRSLSDLTVKKFQRILNQELQKNYEKPSDNPLCDYICDTFLERPSVNIDEFFDCTDRPSNNIDSLFLGNKFEYNREAMEVLEKTGDTWGMDIFEIHKHTSNTLLVTVFSIFEKRQFLSKFNIPNETLINFLISLENSYRNLPYHNSIHAADVTHSSHIILHSISLQDVFTDLEMFAVIFASAIHDVDHPGVSNQYLINTNDPLAILYNDRSILENHHLATAFRLLNDNKCDILKNLDKVEKSKFRRLVIDMVLATDMSGHISLLADLKTMIETKKVIGCGVLNLDNYNDRIKILQCLIHCSDLSNPAKTLSIYLKWVNRIYEEFYHQGDLERDMGLDISIMCDRNISPDDKTQIGFIDYIVYPLWETWCDLVHPDVPEIMENLKENRKFYIQRVELSNHTL